MNEHADTSRRSASQGADRRRRTRRARLPVPRRRYRPHRRRQLRDGLPVQPGRACKRAIRSSSCSRRRPDARCRSRTAASPTCSSPGAIRLPRRTSVSRPCRSVREQNAMETETTLAPLLTIAPTQRELGGLGYGNARTRTSIVGIGRVAGEQVAALLDAAPCRLLVSLGYAGALDPHLHPGDLVVANAYLHGASAPVPGALHTTRAAMLLRQAGISALEGPVLTVDEPLLSPRAKRRRSTAAARWWSTWKDAGSRRRQHREASRSSASVQCSTRPTIRCLPSSQPSSRMPGGGSGLTPCGRCRTLQRSEASFRWR